MQLPDWAVQYWVVWAFGLLTACLAALWRYALAQHKRQKALETGVQALLRDRIIQSCDYYQKKQTTTTRKSRASRCMAGRTSKVCTQPITPWAAMEQ